MRKFTLIAAGISIVCMTIPAAAQRGTVARVCAADIQSYCADKDHGSRQTRTCLESNRDKLTAECRQALDSTGPGSGRGKGRNQ